MQFDTCLRNTNKKFRLIIDLLPSEFLVRLCAVSERSYARKTLSLSDPLAIFRPASIWFLNWVIAGGKPDEGHCLRAPNDLSPCLQSSFEMGKIRSVLLVETAASFRESWHEMSHLKPVVPLSRMKSQLCACASSIEYHQFGKKDSSIKYHQFSKKDSTLEKMSPI